MSINSAMLAGVSGLVSNSAALAAISDNIANVNTVGYKRNATSFQTVVTTAASKGAYNAGGVLAATRQMVSQQGLLQQSTSSTDLGISGQGFFVTTSKAENVTDSDARTFTRAGSFELDSQGYLKNASGLYLQGWLVNDLGGIDVDPSDLSRLKSINVGAVGGTADPTSRVTVNANLNASTVISTQEPTWTGAGATSMAAYDPNTAAGIKPDYSLQIPVSDSKGGKRTLQIDFLKSATANEWHAEIHAVPAADMMSDPNGIVAKGTVVFTADGQIDMAATDLFGPPVSVGPPVIPADPVLDIGASAGPAGTAGQWETALGVDAQQIRIELGLAPGGLTQYSSQSVTQSISTNGTNFGSLTNIDIDEQGNVVANFDNGVSRMIAQVAIATFPNPGGLRGISGNGYRVALGSGAYNLKAPGTGGAGLLAPSTLESSTVDLSSEFTGLITTQRAYSASSKIITTADQMLEELINIKR
ncbi:MAG TPA: flagellar hook protein FlgE [Caulobacteraceae bacterium]|nr:flagellar hook protein FlgE [Caulobacteraceae bacterium]